MSSITRVSFPKKEDDDDGSNDEATATLERESQRDEIPEFVTRSREEMEDAGTIRTELLDYLDYLGILNFGILAHVERLKKRFIQHVHVFAQPSVSFTIVVIYPFLPVLFFSRPSLFPVEWKILSHCH